MEDELLNLWIDVSTAINNSRIVQTLPYNEAHICNHLFRISGQDHDTMTPTQLCNATGMAKSLMNRTLRSLEEKGLIERVEQSGDRRSTPVRLCEAQRHLFIEEHEHSLDVVRQMVTQMGEENSVQVLQALQVIRDAAAHVMKGINV